MAHCKRNRPLAGPVGIGEQLPTATICSSTGRFEEVTFRQQIGEGPGGPDPEPTCG